MPMAVIHRLQQYLARVPRLLLVVIALRHDPVEQLAPLARLHHQEERVLLVEEVVQADDVGAAVQRRKDGHLVLEGDDVLLLELGPLDALDGELLGGGALVRAAPDGGEGPGPELCGCCFDMIVKLVQRTSPRLQFNLPLSPQNTHTFITGNNSLPCPVCTIPRTASPTGSPAGGTRRTTVGS